MHRTITDLDRVFAVEPRQGVFHPDAIIAVGVILAGMSASTLCPILGRMQGHHCLLQQIFEFEGFDEVSVPDHRAVGNPEIAQAVGDDIDPADTFS